MSSKSVVGFSKEIPILITEENRLSAGVFLFGSAAALYLLSNHFHFFTPQLLSLTDADQRVPFLPQSVWIYLSEYLLFGWVYFSIKDLRHLNRYFFSFFTLQLFSVLIFWIWPTSYPRELFPFPSDLDKMTYLVFSSLRSTDSPASCCPSLHVSATLLTALLFRDDQRASSPWKVRGIGVWAALICLSTLTTKQHYFIDVFAGLAMGILAFWIFHRIIPIQSESLKPSQSKISADGI